MSAKTICWIIAGLLGVVASVIAILQFFTGMSTFEDVTEDNRGAMEFRRYSRTVNRSSITDYQVYVNGSNTEAERFDLLASRVSGFFRNENTLVLLNCGDGDCNETSLFETDSDETIINASVDPALENIIAFTERRAIYMNLRSNLFSETPYTYSCQWFRNRFQPEPVDRMFERISIARRGPAVAIQFTFSGWTCDRLEVGQQTLVLRPPVGLEINRFKSYRIEMLADRLGLLTLQSSTPL